MVIELAEIPTSVKGLEDAMNRLIFAVHKGDQDGIVETCETISLAYKRLLHEIAELHDLLQLKAKVTH